MDFITQWGQVAGLAGIAVGVFLVLFREIIRKNIFPKLSKKQSFTILLVFMGLTFSIGVLSIYLYYSRGASMRSSALSVLVYDVEKGKDYIVLPNRGKVKLLVGDAVIEEVINSKGEATFKQLPSTFFEAGTSVQMQFFDPLGEPYRALNPDSLYALQSGQRIDLPVKLYGLGILWGTVTDRLTNDPVSGAGVRVRGAATETNEYGEFELEIPPEYQTKIQTVRAYKKGYEPFKLDSVVVQTSGEFPILLVPKNKP